jgi:hypothetical protein
VAAALGTRVVQEHQEALMASAWEQAAQVQAANQRLRQMQLSLAVAQVIYTRHFASPAVSDEMMTRLAAPAFGRLQPGGSSLIAQQLETGLPLAANRVAMRRIGRQRGPLTRRVASKGSFTRSATNTWIARMNRSWTEGSEPIDPPTPPPPVWAVPGPFSQWTRALDYTANGLPSSYFGAFFVRPEGTTVTQPGVEVIDLRVEAPDFFRSAAREQLRRLFPSRPATPAPEFVSFENVKQAVLDAMQPQAALSSLARAIITTGDGVLAPTAPGVASKGVETIMAAPHFSHPMYETLRDLSQELFLPGLDRIKPESVLALRTNRRFMEAFMVGLNHEFGRELLWRGYPTDQRGTYFDHFWGNGIPNSAPADITALHTWSTPVADEEQRQLGDALGAPTVTEEFVLVIRSSLLRRYPNAVIYLAPAVRAGAGAPDPDALIASTDPAQQQEPLFSGSVQPDVVFFGFAVSVAAAIGDDGGDGYYVVIQEHPTEPRFGIDEDFVASAGHLGVTPEPPPGLDLQGGIWNANAAQMALITRRLPIRMAIHAVRLISPA